MIIKYVKLQNIRSYINEEIHFPEGSILLSGDIGSGKSTILLAIEFGLFGIKRGELSGESLLRMGKISGFVELGFSIDGKEIVVHRKLRRGKDMVGQDSGWIEINERRKEASPNEIKSDILELLGYPPELLSKGKDILFRYTVYTPQEEMKQILLEGKELRLDTLRRVFQIDRYKRIKENASILVRDLKEKRKMHEGRAADMESKQAKLAEEQEKLEADRAKVKSLEPLLAHAKKTVKVVRERFEGIESKIKRLGELRREFHAREIDLINKLDQRERNKHEIEQLAAEISRQDANMLLKEIEANKEISSTIAQKKSSLDSHRKNLLEMKSHIAQLKAKENSSVEIKDKIRKLDICPLCEQQVASDHKHAIEKREDKKISDLTAQIEAATAQVSKIESSLSSLESEIDSLRKKEAGIETLKVKWRNLQKDLERQKKLNELQDGIKREIGAINVAKSALQKEIDALADSETQHGIIRKELDAAILEERKIEIEHSGTNREAALRERITASLRNEIVEKAASKAKVQQLSQYIGWLEEFFMNLMSSIERSVMGKIHAEFNGLFKEWFAMLIEDETLSVRMDDEFTPIVEQNGYEIDMANLSGGEKTSCALAYRLALNQVINNIVGTIKTKDLIILDEPTDGFSTEQLDRVRDIIDQIRMRQIIIVSHEPKIESFVKNIIRVTKHEHVSRVEQT